MNTTTTHMEHSIITLVESNDESFSIIKVPDFLKKEQRDDIFNSLLENKNEFFSCGKEVLTKHLFLKDMFTQMQFKDLNSACDVLSKSILAIMPDIFSVLEVEPFDILKIRFNFIHGLDGHYGDPHSDDYGNGLEITILYYFHVKPKSFDGGDLLFYDNMEDKNIIKKIDYEDNLFIAFPSSKVHGVSKISSDSSNFEDGRFVGVTFIGPNIK